ncbi:ABC transporter substrate-binding protein [Pseudooceanicola sp. MF1-13]|uniref:ABC transporter substrate-binding protein n=1 Tax=Pseudooceanicola sp. MF1-13 TaxID=3379095 RepID=UPI003892C0ED
MSRYSKSLWTRRRLLGTGAAVLAAPVIAPRHAWARGDEIRLGWVSPTTGPIASFGASDDYVLDGVRKAIGEGIEINGKTYPVRIIEKDSQSSPNRAAEVASELILDDEVHLMLSSSTADTVLPVTDQCELNEVPSVSTDTPWDAFFFARGGDPAVGFDWTYHFFWGAGQIIDCYASLWSQIDTNNRVGLLLSNDSDGVAMSHPKVGMAAMMRERGLEVIDGGLFEPLSDDYSAQIGKMKDAGVDIITGAFLPPDWTTFWVQASQQGFRPKAATIAKAILFPTAVEALGDLGQGVSSEVWWSPDHPYSSGLTGQSSAELAAGYEQASGRQWIQPTGYKHALLEVAIDVLKRCDDPMDAGAMMESIKATNANTIVGPVSWKDGPVPNAATTPVVGGQWVKGEQHPYDLKVAENKYAPEITVQTEFKALS